MIQHIHQQLNQWAIWLHKCNDGGLGYRSSSLNIAMAQACQQHPEAAQHAQINEQEMMTIETAVRRKLSQDARRVIDIVYLSYGTGADKAKSLGCHRDTLYARLHNAHIELSNLLDSSRLAHRSDRVCVLHGRQQSKAANHAMA